MCGRLWCTHANEKLMAYGKSVGPISQPMPNGRRCHAVAVDVSSANMQHAPYADLGLVPDGSPCGTNFEKVRVLTRFSKVLTRCGVRFCGKC